MSSSALRSVFVLLLLLLVSLCVLSCGTSSPSGSSDPELGDVEGIVYLGNTTQRLSGVSIMCGPSGGPFKNDNSDSQGGVQDRRS